MKINNFILAGVLLAALAGCNLAPRYKTPSPPSPVPAHFKEEADWAQTPPADEISRGPWWEMFADADLNALEVKLGSGNQDLKVMIARYDEARATASFARADFFPTVTGTASATHERDSRNLPNTPTRTSFNDFLVGADFTYEIDVWGRVRNLVAAAGSRAEASKADAASVELSLRAELAGDYFILRGDDEMQAILDQTVTDYQKAFDLTQNRFKGGASPEADVDQAQTQLQNAKTQASDMRLKRSQLEHAIAVLVGEIPSDFSLPVKPYNVKLPAINTGLPSTLLLRRPDVAAAERRASAANNDIGVARAAWFPQFNLAGSFGFESAAASSLFSNPSQFWTLGPSAVLGFLDIGHISALNEEARAAFDEAAASYRKSVLVAYQEVEDNLVALHRLAEESQSQTLATEAAGRALKQENYRYSGGIATYLDVVISQNTALQAKLALIDIETRRMTASVLLVKALGGGWNDVAPKPAPAAR